MDRPVLEVMRGRFSCRTYLPKPIEDRPQAWLRIFLEGHQAGPFGSPTRLGLVAAMSGDERALKGLGTYGAIKNAQGFIIGAMGPGPKNLEDFGFVMERAILAAAALGLGTCWIGGVFTRSRFAKAIGVSGDETVPAVAVAGYCADERKSGGWIGRAVRRSSRLPREKIFFSNSFDRPLEHGDAGFMGPALESVRWAPSASNKQPWRVVRREGKWHFYLQRTKGYGNRGAWGKLVGMADLQRVDMGIAMCHFDQAARELGAAGTWEIAAPAITLPDELSEYTATWREAPPADAERV